MHMMPAGLAAGAAADEAWIGRYWSSALS